MPEIPFIAKNRESLSGCILQIRGLDWESQILEMNPFRSGFRSSERPSRTALTWTTPDSWALISELVKVTQANATTMIQTTNPITINALAN